MGVRPPWSRRCPPGIIRRVQDPLSYAKEVATTDVRATLQELEEAGFTVTHQRGGRSESFGNVLIDLEAEDGTRVEIVRDRSQWSCKVTRPGLPGFPLNVLVTAMNPEAEVAVLDRGFGDPLPEQLPEGVVWTTTVPEAIAWLRSADRTVAIQEADRRWRAAMRAHLGYPEDSP
jgi:hypothetical protein